MNRLRVITNRLLHLIPVLFGVSLVVFILMQLIPGDPIRLLVGERATPEVIAAVRAQYGLDLPMWQQYFTFITNAVQGDLGRSIVYRIPVSQLISNFMAPSVFLISYVIIMSVPATVILSVISGQYQGRLPDQIISFLAVVGLSTPIFWLGILMARFFGVELGWFPVTGFGETFLEHLHHLFLPALSTSIWVVPVLYRNLRSAIIEEMESDYVVASRSKGLPEGYIFRKHILINSILPTLNLLGLMVAYLIGGTVVVEIVYALPGLGDLIISSILSRDYFVVQGMTVYIALVTVCITLFVDILSALIDPRIEL